MNNTLEFSIPTSGEEEQRELFAGFARAGFDGLQLKGGQYARYLNAPEKFIEDWGQMAGGALICGGALDENGVAQLRQICEFGAAIGAARIVFCHGHPRAAVTDTMRRDWARLLSELKVPGVQLSLHQHTDQPIMTRADLRVFFENVTPGALGLTLDTAHLVKSGETDIAGIIAEFSPWLDNVHLKDFARGEFATLGCGDIDWPPIFAALRAINYRGPLCADEESGASVSEGLRAARAFLAAHWEI